MGGSRDNPIPDRQAKWISPQQASLDYERTSFSYTSRVTALPTSTFRVFPSSSILFDQSLLYGLF
jgi:hypothetical protein